MPSSQDSSHSNPSGGRATPDLPLTGTGSLGGLLPWKLLGRQLKLTLPWVVFLLAVVGVNWLISVAFDLDGGVLRHPEPGTTAQVVPAIVIAIFVFAVGTLFVVAQVVPPARGTRAVTVLRRRHRIWTISPALVLAPGSALVLALPGAAAEMLASALLLGAVVYLLASTASLLDILREATDPAAFAHLMARQQARALRRLSEKPAAQSDECTLPIWEPPTWSWWTGRPHNTQAAVDELYGVSRTLRGWARSAATAGDSRELHVALDATLAMVKDYHLTAKDHNALPTAYWENAVHQDTSALYRRRRGGGGEGPFATWFPDPLKLDDKSPKASPRRSAGDRGLHAQLTAAMESRDLVETWLANEVGRSVVRAVEFATTSKTLLDRDRSRLLLTMEKAVHLYVPHPEAPSNGQPPREDPPSDMASAGVLVGYFIELGLGVRRCPPEEITWHFDPLISLVRLHEIYDDGKHAVLATGTAAGVLKIAEAITSARARDVADKQGTVWLPVDHDNFNTYPTYLTGLINRTSSELRQVANAQKFKLLHGTKTMATGDAPSDAPIDPVAKAEETAAQSWFEPHDLPFILPTSKRVVTQLGKNLRQGASDPSPAAP